MKKYSCFITILAIMFCTRLYAQQHQLIKKWQTDSLLKVPESVLYDAADNLLYVSNIDGESGAKDGKGSVGKVGLDGKIIQVDWVSGLNAPKGLGKYNGKLYVADLTEVAVIDIKAARIIKRIAGGRINVLNDITIDKNGVVFVSDTRMKKVFRIAGITFLPSWTASA